MINWIVGAIVLLIILFAVYRVFKNRKNSEKECGGKQSIYGIPDENIPSYCQDCRARFLCQKNPPESLK